LNVKINLKGMLEDRGIMKEAENIIKKSNFYKDKILKYIEGKI
jgi:formiminotetrahydrofolate cyclodeaminase